MATERITRRQKKAIVTMTLRTLAQKRLTKRQRRANGTNYAQSWTKTSEKPRLRSRTTKNKFAQSHAKPKPCRTIMAQQRTAHGKIRAESRRGQTGAGCFCVEETNVQTRVHVLRTHSTQAKLRKREKKKCERRGKTEAENDCIKHNNKTTHKLMAKP